MSSQQSPPGSISIASPTPSNMVDLSAPFIDEEDPNSITITIQDDSYKSDSQRMHNETPIWIEIDFYNDD